MDMVDYSFGVFEKIKSEFETIRKKLQIEDVSFIPISALKGDNVVTTSTNMDWFAGKSLLSSLETIPIDKDFNRVDPRFPVQYIIRPNCEEYHDYRGYAGRIEGGVFHVGDEVMSLPSKLISRIKSIDTFTGSVKEAFSPQSVTITLEDDIDISRGNMIVQKENIPLVGQDIELMICWLNEKPMTSGGKYLIRHTTNDARCIIKEIDYKVNINTVENDYEDKLVKMNDIARIKIRVSKPLFFDSYKKNRITGSLVLIDEGTNETVGAGMIF
jgi:sulfate adenylyltransferase subunit 1